MKIEALYAEYQTVTKTIDELDKLQRAIEKLNGLKVVGPRGKTMEFQLVSLK